MSFEFNPEDEDPHGECRHEIQRLKAINADLLNALREADAFIGVMFGRGEDGIVPETITLPLGVPCKLGEIVRDIQAAIAKAEGASQ
jgi:hypothetical protein